jgi:hypothetical protein
MSGVARIVFPSMFYHIIRGIEGHPIFRDSQDYDSFLLFYVLWAILVRFLLSQALMLCPASFAAM